MEVVYFYRFFVDMNSIFPKYESHGVKEKDGKYVLNNRTLSRYKEKANKHLNDTSFKDFPMFSDASYKALINKIRYFLYPDKRLEQNDDIISDVEFVNKCIDFLSQQTRREINFSFLSLVSGYDSEYQEEIEQQNNLKKDAIEHIFNEIISLFMNSSCLIPTFDFEDWERVGNVVAYDCLYDLIFSLYVRYCIAFMNEHIFNIRNIYFTAGEMQELIEWGILSISQTMNSTFNYEKEEEICNVLTSKMGELVHLVQDIVQCKSYSNLDSSIKEKLLGQSVYEKAEWKNICVSTVIQEANQDMMMNILNSKLYFKNHQCANYLAFSFSSTQKYEKAREKIIEYYEILKEALEIVDWTKYPSDKDLVYLFDKVGLIYYILEHYRYYVPETKEHFYDPVTRSYD